jgi:hypothetical protein
MDIEKHKASAKLWKEANREKVLEMKRKSHHKNKKEYNTKRALARKLSRETLDDTHIKLVLTKGNKLGYEDITPELIELKRQQLKLYRYGKEA